MDINSLRGASAYANTPGTSSPPVDQALLQNPDNTASKAELVKETANTTQKAFEVTITQEAREKSASATLETSEKQLAPSVDQTARNAAKAYETSQIVNIVA